MSRNRQRIEGLEVRACERSRNLQQRRLEIALSFLDRPTLEVLADLWDRLPDLTEDAIVRDPTLYEAMDDAERAAWGCLEALLSLSVSELEERSAAAAAVRRDSRI